MNRRAKRGGVGGINNFGNVSGKRVYLGVADIENQEDEALVGQMDQMRRFNTGGEFPQKSLRKSRTGGAKRHRPAKETRKKGRPKKSEGGGGGVVSYRRACWDSS